jgi:rhodanese-related sulfurtransferase
MLRTMIIRPYLPLVGLLFLSAFAIQAAEEPVPTPPPAAVSGSQSIEDLTAMQAAERLSADKAKALAQPTHVPLKVLDIRTPAEFAQGHLQDATNIDFLAADFEAKLAALDPAKPLLVHCKSGGRSGRSMALFKKLGFKSILHMKDGYQGWVAAKQPVTPAGPAGK